LAELNQLCATHSSHLVAVTETWYQPHISDPELAISGMSLLRRDRTARGGGVALYYNRQLSCREICDDDLVFQDTLWCRVSLLTGEECIVGVIYRPPSVQESYNLSLLEKIHLIASRYRSKMLIMGDFNLPNLFKNETHPINSIENVFQDLMHDLPLYNHVVNNTRYGGSDAPSTLDLVLTSEEHVVENIAYLAPLGLSDHVIITFDYLCRAERSSDAHKMIRKLNMVELAADFQTITDWSLSSDDVDQHCSGLLTQLHDKIRIHSDLVPKKAKNGYQFQLRSRTKKLLRVRNAAWVDHLRYSTQKTWETYRLLRNKTTQRIREDKQQYQARLMKKMEKNPKLLYQIVNSHSKVKPGVAALSTSNGITFTAEEAAEELAKFYSTVYRPKEHVPLTKAKIFAPSEALSYITVEAGSVLQALLGLKEGKSPGADKITPLILKRCAQSLHLPLTSLFNHSLNEGQVPADWKCGIIAPIYKSGNRSDVSNYRPVTLLPTISKVLERLVADRLVKHLEERKILSDEQHGFRKNRSCVSNLLLTRDDWTKAVDQGTSVHACYLDFSKAFDRVNHSILLQKLNQHGITGKLLTWFESYLTDRTVQVRVDGALSKPVAVTSGVPQGSVLGPILFLLYANDIPLLVRCKIILFADDIKLWSCIQSSEDCIRLQQDLDALYSWSQANKIPFNMQKCKMLNIGRRFDFTYTLGSHQLEWCEAEKDLGVWIHSSLKTSVHCKNVYQRTSKILALLKRIFGSFSRQMMPMLLNTYIRPSMEYAVQVWSSWLQKDTNLLQRIYHRATKSVIGLQGKPYAERIVSLNLFDFRYRRIRGDLILTYNILHTPDHPLKQLFHPASDRVTRLHRFALAIPYTRVNCRRYFFSVRVSFLWNSLPESVVSCTNLSSFKHALDNFMQSNEIAELGH